MNKVVLPLLALFLLFGCDNQDLHEWAEQSLTEEFFEVELVINPPCGGTANGHGDGHVFYLSYNEAYQSSIFVKIEPSPGYNYRQSFTNSVAPVTVNLDETEQNECLLTCNGRGRIVLGVDFEVNSPGP